MITPVIATENRLLFELSQDAAAERVSVLGSVEITLTRDALTERDVLSVNAQYDDDLLIIRHETKSS